MKKSVPAFVLGLIFSIIGALSAYLYYAIFILVGAFSGHLFTAVTVLPILNLISFGISFLGSIICLIKRQVGGSILIIASIISLICYIVTIVCLKIYKPSIFIFLIPTIIIFLCGIIALKKSKKQSVTNDNQI